MLDKFKACVLCTTYNHSKYIKDTLDGFCAQQTDFPFVCIIVDDASIDGEQSVINEYVKKNLVDSEYSFVIPKETSDYLATSAQCKSNRNCHFIFFCLKYNHYGKKSKLNYYIEIIKKANYIVLCEGDDFWTDKYKLKKQVDILNSKDDVTLVYSGFECVDENGEKIFRPGYEKFMQKSKSGDIFLALFEENFILTLTTCFRRNIFLSPYITSAPVSQDLLYTLFAAAMGKVIYLPEKTGCYRLSPNGAMQTQGRIVVEKNLKIRNYIAKLYFKGKLRKRNFILDIMIIKNIIKKNGTFFLSKIKMFLKRIGGVNSHFQKNKIA